MATSSTAKYTPEEITRTTKSGRKLRYTLTVIQQPERARACGSGAKSSADRRPVDPPPVVQLRIHDETDPGQAKEITFHYNANFFLFATLEVARPIAQGRVHQAATTPQVPVLTGMPVSGMAYLDRPNEAGYFIFPDLSVRHEGIYKLSFNLYEETKEERDADADPSNDGGMRKMSNAAATSESSFDWRMELKSAAFTVFSAKKFPGLTESTDLSRCVAEQGCRVRIRRDVRMRRREAKTGEGFDEGMEDEYSGQGRPPSPPMNDYMRHRSPQSVGSNEGSPQQRRGSGEFSPYHSPSPPTPNAPPPPGGVLGFIPQTGYVPGQPAAFAQPPPPPPPPTAYQHQPMQNIYQNQGQPSPFRQGPPISQGPPPPPPGNYPGYEDRQPYSHYRPANNPPFRPDVRQSYDPEYNRRMSVASGYNAPHTPQPIAPAVQSPPYSQPVESVYNRNSSMSSSYSNHHREPSSVDLAPLRAEHPDAKFGGAMSPLAPLSSIPRIAPNLAPMPNHSYNKPQERSGSYSYPGSMSMSVEAEPIRPKRAYDMAFSTTNEPLFNGMRPSSTHEDAINQEEELKMRQMKMSYPRADGTLVHRDAPEVE